MNEFSELWLTVSWRRDRKTEREREREIGFCFGVCDSVVWDWGGIEIRVYIYIYIYIVFIYVMSLCEHARTSLYIRDLRGM